MLTPQQHRIVTLLAQGNSIIQAAELENIHRNTISNWRRTIPAFASQLEQALGEQRQYFQDQAVQLAPLAIKAIEDCLTNPNASPALRFRAATFIIKMATTPKSAPMHKIEQLASFDPRESAQSAAEQLASFVPPESEPQETELPAQSCTTKPQPIRVVPQPGRNAQCPCGSRQKYKRCCISKAA